MTGKALVLIVLAVAAATSVAPAGDEDDHVAALGRAVADVAIAQDLVARWPMHGLLGSMRVAEALELKTDDERTAVERWWAEQIPLFDCPDDAWKRCWYYRWFLVLVNYAEEDGTPGFYEGKRGHFQRHITGAARHIQHPAWLCNGCADI